MLLKIIRFIVGKIILALNAIFSPTPIQREATKQAAIDKETAPLALYQFEACPFCVKARRAIKRMNLKIELRDAANNSVFKNELLTGGGKVQVPCLRIPESDGKHRWLYESSDIIRYLEEKFLN